MKKSPDFQKGEYIFCPNHSTPGILCFERVLLILSYNQSNPARAVTGSCWGDGSDDDNTCHAHFGYSLKEAEELVLTQWKEDAERQVLIDQRKEAMKAAQCNTHCPSCGNLCEEISVEKRKAVNEKYPYPKH